jgi:divalent metal cation (Fe/Co/Zn/Cd) transporter
VFIGQRVNIQPTALSEWLFRADSIAALGVSAIVTYVSYQLGRRTINALLDTAHKGIAARIEPELVRLAGILAVQRIRVRQSGPATFVDMTLAVPRTASLEEAHAIAARAEATVQRLVPNTDVMIHIDPVVSNEKSLVELVRSIAMQQGINVHSLRIHDVRGQSSLEMHAEVPDDLTVKQAHERVTALERALSGKSPELRDIVVHIEPVGDIEAHRQANYSRSTDLQEIIKQVSKQLPGIRDCHNISILYEGDKMSVAFHCTLASNLPITQAHEMTIQFEDHLRGRLPRLGSVIIHVEPPES